MAYNAPNKAPAKTEAPKNRPETEFRAGTVKATVWRNNGTSKAGKEYSFATVNLQRSYTDDKGEWKNTDSLRVNDLPAAVLALNKAYEYLKTKHEQEAEQ